MFTIDPILLQDLILLCQDTQRAEWHRFNESYNQQEQDHYDNALNFGRRVYHLTHWEEYDRVAETAESIIECASLDPEMIAQSGTNGQPGLPHFISCLFKENHSQGIQPHTDPRNQDGWYHLRVNFVLQNVEKGGEPVIGNSLLDIKTGDVWAVWASEHKHRALPVRSEGERIITSFGFFVNPDYIYTAQDNIEKYITHFPGKL